MTELRLFDTHCHFDFDIFAAEFDTVLRRSLQSGVRRFVIPAVGPDNWERVEQLACHYAPVYFALGFHPYFLERYSLSQMATLEEKLSHRHMKCVAVGECGLDHVIDIEKSLQEQFFLTQISLAKNNGLPLILHSRKSHNRLLQLLKQEKFTGGGVLHGFSGSYQQALQFTDLGFKIGVGGTITYPRANKTRLAVAKLPMQHLVLETDSPDMPMYGHQGQTNFPFYLPMVLKELALLKNEPLQTVADAVWNNSCQLFKLNKM